MKKLLTLLFLLVLVFSVTSYAEEIKGYCVQHLYPTSRGQACKVTYSGSGSCSFTFSTAGAVTFYVKGALDTTVGSNGIIQFSTKNDTDEACNIGGFVNALNGVTNYKAVVLDAMDVDTVGIMDTSTVTTVEGQGNTVPLSGGVGASCRYAVGNDTTCFEQIRLTPQPGRKIRVYRIDAYNIDSSHGCTLTLHNAATGVEIWRSTDSTSSEANPDPYIDFGDTGQDFLEAIVIKAIVGIKAVWASGSYLQVRYATGPAGANW